MQGKPDITPEGLTKDEQIGLLASMLARSNAQAESLSRAYESQIEGINAAHAAEMEAERGRHALEVQALHDEIALLSERILIAGAQRFGSKSEKVVPNQPCLPIFNAAEALFAGDAKSEPALESKALGPSAAPSGKKKKGRKPRRIVTDGLPREVHEHVLAGDGAACGECGAEMAEYKVTVREVVKLVPAHFVVEEHRIHHYVCPECSKANARGEESKASFKSAGMDALPIEKSWAHPSLIADVIYRKYVNAMPLYRVQQDFLATDPNMGISRQCMAGWVIKSWERWLSLIHRRMKQTLLGETLLQADETRIQVLKEPGRLPSAMSYMWLFATSACCPTPVYMFEYRPSRSAEVPRAFLEGWTGALMTDCYASYYALDGVENLSCLVHIRREFIEVVKGLEEKRLERAGSYADQAVRMLTAMFAVDNRFGAMPPEERFEMRNLHLRPLMEEFGAWLGENGGKALPESKLDKAMKNAARHWPDVMRVLEDGRYPLENNRCERAIRPFAIGRKNWMFSDTQRGAMASAAIYSIVATARANGVKVRGYIEWLLAVMPNTDDVSDPAVLETLMPWSPSLPKRLLVDPGEPRVEPDDPIVDADPHLLERIDRLS